MRQDLPNRGAIVQFPDYTPSGEKFVDDMDLYKKLYNYRTYGPVKSFNEPVILIPGLCYGLVTSTWSRLENFRVVNKLENLRIYIATWEESSNIDYLRLLMKAKKDYPNLDVRVQTWSYEGKEFLSYIEDIFYLFGIDFTGYVPESCFKRYVTPFIYKASVDWLSELEDNPLVLKTRAACSFSTTLISVEESFDIMRTHLPFNFSNKQILNSNFGENFFISKFISDSTVGDINFTSPLNTLKRMFSSSFVEDFVNITKLGVADIVTKYPTTVRELDEFTRANNYAAPFDGSVWLGSLLNYKSIPAIMDISNFMAVFGRVYRLDAPRFMIEDYKVIKKGTFKVRGSLPKGENLFRDQLY